MTSDSRAKTGNLCFCLSFNFPYRNVRPQISVPFWFHDRTKCIESHQQYGCKRVSANLTVQEILVKSALFFINSIINEFVHLNNLTNSQRQKSSFRERQSGFSVVSSLEMKVKAS